MHVLGSNHDNSGRSTKAVLELSHVRNLAPPVWVYPYLIRIANYLQDPPGSQERLMTQDMRDSSRITGNPDPQGVDHTVLKGSDRSLVPPATLVQNGRSPLLITRTDCDKRGGRLQTTTRPAPRTPTRTSRSGLIGESFSRESLKLRVDEGGCVSWPKLVLLRTRARYRIRVRGVRPPFRQASRSPLSVVFVMLHAPAAIGGRP